VHALGHLLEQGGCKLGVGRILGQVDGDEELLCFGINVTDVDTALVCEEDPVAL
jgi:hypothetical protein